MTKIAQIYKHISPPLKIILETCQGKGVDDLHPQNGVILLLLLLDGSTCVALTVQLTYEIRGLNFYEFDSKNHISNIRSRPHIVLTP